MTADINTFIIIYTHYTHTHKNIKFTM